MFGYAVEGAAQSIFYTLAHQIITAPAHAAVNGTTALVKLGINVAGWVMAVAAVETVKYAGKGAYHGGTYLIEWYNQPPQNTQQPTQRPLAIEFSSEADKKAKTAQQATEEAASPHP